MKKYMLVALPLVLILLVLAIQLGSGAAGATNRQGHAAAVAMGKPATKTPTPVPPTATPGGATATPTPPALKAWTLMIYLDTDNNLEEYVTKDIETEYNTVGSTANMNILILADRVPGYDTTRGDWTQTLLYYVTPGMLADEASALADWGERNMGDPQTLIDFVQFAKTNYPAQRYFLSLSNHGWMWRPLQTIWDETSYDALDMDEIEAAIAAMGPVDVVAYETCQGAIVENMALWNGHTQSIAFSEDTMGLTSFEWETFLPILNANPTMSNNTFAVELAKTQMTWTSSAFTFGAPATNLITAVDEMSVAMLNGLPTYRSAYDAARAATTGMLGDPLNMDLYDVAKEVKARVSDSTIQAKCQAVMDAILAARLYEWHKGYYKDTYGVSIFWPKVPADLDEASSPENDFDFYRTHMEFSTLTHWDDFLAAYVQ
jgi:hypothetical protein